MCGPIPTSPRWSRPMRRTSDVQAIAGIGPGAFSARAAAPARRMTIDVNHGAYDAVVVGAGLGGLLAAASIAKRGGSVLVLERLRYVGGRFTTVSQDGYEVTTGALHMAPHGAGGPLARTFRELGLTFDGVP